MQAENAASAGASVVVIANNNSNGYFRLTPSQGARQPGIPVFAVPLSAYSTIAASIQIGSKLTLQLQSYTLLSSKSPIATPSQSFQAPKKSTCMPFWQRGGSKE